MERLMHVYTDPNSFIEDSHNKFLLRITSEECKVLLAALTSFNSIEATNKPDLSSLQLAIKELDSALGETPDKNGVDNSSYQVPVKGVPCLD